MVCDNQWFLVARVVTYLNCSLLMYHGNIVRQLVCTDKAEEFLQCLIKESQGTMVRIIAHVQLVKV